MSGEESKIVASTSTDPVLEEMKVQTALMRQLCKNTAEIAKELQTIRWLANGRTGQTPG